MESGWTRLINYRLEKCKTDARTLTISQTCAPAHPRGVGVTYRTSKPLYDEFRQMHVRPHKFRHEATSPVTRDALKNCAVYAGNASLTFAPRDAVRDLIASLNPRLGFVNGNYASACTENARLFC